MKYGFVVSDLYVFSPVAKNCDIIKGIEATSRKSDFLVLNGDIFDFSNTNQYNITQKIECAEKLIKNLVKNNPKRNLIYVFGKNDRYAPFIKRLEKLSKSNENFKVFNVYAKIGENFFIHGDLVATNTDVPVTLERKKNILEKSWQKIIKKFIYVRKIAHFIKKQKKQDEIKKVYFGHIQKPFMNYNYKGMEFNNTGAAIVNSQSLMIPFEINDNYEGGDKVEGF